MQWWSKEVSRVIRSGDDLVAALRNAGDKANQYLAKTTMYYSLRSETHAKTKARWTDRTGNARNGLTATYNVTIGSGVGSSSTFEIEIFHRVKYGLWLEIRKFSKRGDLGIIDKTVQAQGPKFFETANKIMERMSK